MFPLKRPWWGNEPLHDAAVLSGAWGLSPLSRRVVWVLPRPETGVALRSLAGSSSPVCVCFLGAFSEPCRQRFPLCSCWGLAEWLPLGSDLGAPGPETSCQSPSSACSMAGSCPLRPAQGSHIHLRMGAFSLSGRLSGGIGQQGTHLIRGAMSCKSPPFGGLACERLQNSP